MRMKGRKKKKRGTEGRREGGREECLAELEILTKQLFALGIS